MNQLRGKSLFELEPPMHFRVLVGLEANKLAIKALRWLHY